MTTPEPEEKVVGWSDSLWPHWAREQLKKRELAKLTFEEQLKLLNAIRLRRNRSIGKQLEDPSPLQESKRVDAS